MAIPTKKRLQPITLRTCMSFEKACDPVHNSSNVSRSKNFNSESFYEMTFKKKRSSEDSPQPLKLANGDIIGNFTSQYYNLFKIKFNFYNFLPNKFSANEGLRRKVIQKSMIFCKWVQTSFNERITQNEKWVVPNIFFKLKFRFESFFHW